MVLTEGATGNGPACRTGVSGSAKTEGYGRDEVPSTNRAKVGGDDDGNRNLGATGKVTGKQPAHITASHLSPSVILPQGRLQASSPTASLSCMGELLRLREAREMSGTNAHENYAGT